MHSQIEQTRHQLKEEATRRREELERAAQLSAEEIRVKAQAEYDRILMQARTDAALEITKARETLRDSVAVLAVKGAEQILRREVNPSVHKRSTVARPYAEAIFSVAQTSGSSLADWDHWMQKLALATKVPVLMSLLNNPASDTSKLQGVLSSVATSPNATADHVVTLLLKNRRANLLPEIAEQFSEFRAKAESVSEAKIFSPYPVVAGQLQQLLQLLEEKFGRKLRP
ncbi:unnamed protein product, partial [Darwinula stevensoni]